MHGQRGGMPKSMSENFAISSVPYRSGLEMGHVTVNNIETVCLLENYSNCSIGTCMLKNKNRLSKCLSRNVV